MARIACIGTGTVGSAWAAVFARAGHEVALFDSNPSTVNEFTLPRIHRTLAELEDVFPSGNDPDTVAKRLRPAATIADAVADAAYVQESVREEAEIKRAVFGEVAIAAPEDCLLASSTSALPGSTFLLDLPNPRRAMVVHPVNPPSHIPLVEICGTGRTGSTEIERAIKLLREAGMEPIVLGKEIDGFILNRLQYTLVAEAMHLVGEGYCSPGDIDRVMTSGLALRWATIGPFMTAHLNARDGFAGFVEQLGPMMKRMGSEARTDYDWGPDQVARIHDAMAKLQPIEDISEAQAQRNRRILATRLLQREMQPR